MAAITFNAAHQTERVREQLKTVLIAFREMLDAYVSNRMRRAVAEAAHVRVRQFRGRHRRKRPNDRRATHEPRPYAANANTFDAYDRTGSRTLRNLVGR